MRSERVLCGRAEVDGVPVEVDYADVFVVLRDDSTVVAHTDWEAQLRTVGLERITAGRRHLTLHAPDGTTYRGSAVLRFTDGRRHLFRGDGSLDGFSLSPR